MNFDEGKVDGGGSVLPLHREDAAWKTACGQHIELPPQGGDAGGIRVPPPTLILP